MEVLARRLLDDLDFPRAVELVTLLAMIRWLSPGGLRVFHSSRGSRGVCGERARDAIVISTPSPCPPNGAVAVHSISRWLCGAASRLHEGPYKYSDDPSVRIVKHRPPSPRTERKLARSSSP